MTADRHSGGGECFGQIGAPSGMFADLEECRLSAVVLQRLEDHRRVARPGAVVETQKILYALDALDRRKPQE